MSSDYLIKTARRASATPPYNNGELLTAMADTIEALEARVKELESLARWSTRRFRQNNLDIYADYIEGFTSDEGSDEASHDEA